MAVERQLHVTKHLWQDKYIQSRVSKSMQNFSFFIVLNRIVIIIICKQIWLLNQHYIYLKSWMKIMAFQTIMIILASWSIRELFHKFTETKCWEYSHTIVFMTIVK